jgi:hypothetical protein
MTMDEDILIRLKSLEAEIRRRKLAAIVLLTLGADVLIAGAALPRGDQFVVPAKHSRVVAETFARLGNDGRTYARLGTKQNHPVLEFYDSKGNVIWSAPPQTGFKPVKGKER